MQEKILIHTPDERHKMPKEDCILIIDDEEGMRDSCCQALSKEGYFLETAGDGDTGWQKIREKGPDIVLVDLKIPGISGMELLEKTREYDPSIISVVITGYASIESAVEAMRRNAYDFLPKPFTPEQLRIIVKRGLERRRLSIEAMRLRREKKKMREYFITLVSHQLRSPLITILQTFEVILEGFGGKVAGEQKGMMEEVKLRIEELLQLINDWLNMSHMDTGNLIERFEEVKLEPIISKSIELLQPLARKKEIVIKAELDGLPLIIGHKEALKQAFVNIISNGINYNRQGGTMTIRGRAEEDYVVVDISDTGIGISEENLPFIFEEFFRVKNKETQGITGSGLGLSIAKRLIEAHHGNIKVASKAGCGTTFSLFLPKKIGGR